MPSYRRSSRPTLKTKKLETTQTQLITNLGAGVQTLVLAAAPEPVASSIDVPVGSKLRWTQVEFNLSPENIASPKTFHWMIVKNPGNNLVITPTTYGADTRKFVFQRGLEMLPSNTSFLVKRIINVRIPPRYRRMDENDELQFLYLASSTEAMNFCARATTMAEI